MLSIAVIEEILSTYITEPENPPRDLNKVEQARLKQIAATAALPEPSALQALARSFNLSDFERDLLLLCAAWNCNSTLTVCVPAFKATNS